ncbi:hypothetical protein, partial [Microvirga sp. KLBC 81]|uniref:hypothetical protein n=1 Tax=Microvirga sp. KLBC 81 TaxID=1862707 RepID=UPI00197CA877
PAALQLQKTASLNPALRRALKCALTAFRVQAASESPLVTMEWLERNLGDPKHCEPIRIGPDLAKKNRQRFMAKRSGSRCLLLEAAQCQDRTGITMASQH